MFSKISYLVSAFRFYNQYKYTNNFLSNCWEKLFFEYLFFFILYIILMIFIYFSFEI
jgi:hypothetical protein